MTKGIILLAAGYRQYGQMAVALAAQIKRYSPDANIALLYDEKGFSGAKDGIGFFSHTVPIPEEIFEVRGRKTAHRVKLHLDKLTPFDRTLYMDVDSMIWPNVDVSKIFDEPEALKFQLEHWEDIEKPKAGSRLWNAAQGKKGGKSNTIWFDDADTVALYEATTGVIPSYNASLILWTSKDKKVKEFWKKAQDIFDNPHPESKWQIFGGEMPDEYAFDIASLLLGIRFDYERWWPLMHHKPAGAHSLRDYAKMSIGFTMYGLDYRRDNPAFVSHYDNINAATAHYWYKVKGIKYHPYKYTPKSLWNTLRKPI